MIILSACTRTAKDKHEYLHDLMEPQMNGILNDLLPL